jgi:DNA-binding IclR family transcriptional regulator
LDILTAFTAGDQFLGNAEIADRTGIPRSTVSRITATLTELGYLNYAEQIGKYEIGPRVLALSYSLMSKLRVHTTARPLMEELARESNAIVGLAMLDGLNVVFVETALGERPYSQQPQVGFRVPVAFTSMGWACLSVMNINDRTETLKRLEEAYPERAGEIRRNVQQAIADIWQRGFCTSLGALEAGSNAIGVPYLHPDGRHILAFNMTAPNTVLTRKSMETKWGPRLVKLVQRLRASGSDRLSAEPRQARTGEAARHLAR